MRNGYKIYDSDTHITPSAEVLEPFMSKRIKKLTDLDKYKVPIKTGLAGEQRPEPYHHNYRFQPIPGWQGGAIRILGEAEPNPDRQRRFQKFQGKVHPTDGGQERADVRVRDMDTEGIDVQFMVSLGAEHHEDAQVQMEFIRAQHRYFDSFCGYAPDRLKTALVPTPKDVKGSIEEINRWGKSQWCVAIQPYFPPGFPLDHPDMDPIWAAACDHDLAVVHHSYGASYPGAEDLWDNPFIGRTASHPWSGMRAVAAVCGSGLMERFPSLRFGVLEAGFGWLPFWAKRMDEHKSYIGYVSEAMKGSATDYLTSGRFFAGIVVHEGPEMVRMVNQMMGDQILMFASDYPHSESHFPESVDLVLGWESLSDADLKKLFWENPVKFYGEP